MGRIEKTVFISYRRTNLPWALAIYQHLTSHGYDVFFDYLSIPSGDFEKIIIENIRGRAHFIIILTPSALEYCYEPGDWLRREIETAMDEKRNIVPLMLESFDFGNPATIEALTGKLENLKKYNGLRVPSEYFFEAMNRLREQFLNVALDAVVHPISDNARQITEEHQAAAKKAASHRIRIPILGRIVAGEPGEPIPTPISDFYNIDAEASIRIARVLLPTKEATGLFALEIQGDSMTDAMINDGDIVIMKAAHEAKNGEMVAIWLPERNETTLKYFYKEEDRYRLQPANPTMWPIYIDRNDPLEIQGKVVMVIPQVNRFAT
jgi:SOS-response transcriptional repressor LexA